MVVIPGGEDGGAVRVRVRVRDIRGAEARSRVRRSGRRRGDEVEERAHARARDVARAHDETIADGEGVPAFSLRETISHGERVPTVDGRPRAKSRSSAPR